ncbi:MAG: hypothetical protein KAI79_07950 [Bacteroidales bacterium]|nr:hypothetical protein [Bacteroidales bacterium]
MTKIKKLAGVFAICSSLGGLSAQVGAVGNPEFVFNADGKGGVLSIKTLDVNGVKAFENLELELDFTNSQFILNNVSEADNTISENIVEIKGLQVELQNCSAELRVVTCHLLFTSVEFDRTITFKGNIYGRSHASSLVFDNFGNEYFPSSITIANSESSFEVEKKLVADITTIATVRIDNLSTQATSISLLYLKIQLPTGEVYIKFRDISF